MDQLVISALTKIGGNILMNSTEKTAGLLKTVWGDWFAPIKQKRLDNAEIEKYDKLEDLRIEKVIKEKKLMNTAENEIIAENDEFQLARIERIKSRFVRDELINQMNVESIIDKAQQLLPEEISSEPVDKDWFRIFINKAKQFSDDDVQNLWANILAGELQKPSRFSLKTISILENMTKADIELFSNICKYLFTNAVLFYDTNNWHDRFQITFNQVLHLDNLGLLNQEFGLCKVFDINDSNRDKIVMQLIVDDKVYNYRFYSNGKYHINSILLTKSGCELSSFTNSIINQEYIDYSIEYIKKYKIPISISSSLIIHRDEYDIEYSDDEELIFKYE